MRKILNKIRRGLIYQTRKQMKATKNKGLMNQTPTRFRLYVGIGIILVLLPIVLFTIFKPGGAEAEWYNEAWMYRKKITVQHGQVSGSTDFTNFPILIEESADTDLSANAQADGDDIVFTDIHGKKLDHEIESYSSGTLVAWVKMETVYATEDTVLFMYYGNPSASNQENPEGVWSDNFAMVQHMEETTSGNTDFKDSTNNNNDSTTVSFAETGSDPAAAGKINGGIQLSGTNADGVNIGDSEAFTATTQTIECWVNFDDIPSVEGQYEYCLVHNDAGGYYGFEIVFENSTNHPIVTFSKNTGDTASVTGTTTVSPGTWYHIVGVFDGSYVTLYVNSSSEGTPAAWSGTRENSDGDLIIGGQSYDWKRLDGYIDEVRIHSTSRSSDWVITNHAAQNSPSGTFYVLDSVETGPGPIAWWKLDEGVDNTCSNGTDDACDSTSGGNDGAKTGATWQSEDMCISGKCLYFDGSDDTVTVSNTVSGVQTVSFWAKVMNTSTTQQLIDLNGTDYLTSVSGIVTAAGFGTETIYVDGIPNTTITADKWHHIAVTTSSSLSASAIKIGQISTDYGNVFIDEVKIYPYARSADQVKADYNTGASVLGVKTQSWMSEGLLGYWKLNESSGNASDASGNGVTLTNNGTTTFVAGKFGNGSEHVPASSQYLSAGSTISGVKTVSFWVNPDSTTNYYVDLDTTYYLSSSSGTLDLAGSTAEKIYVNGEESTTVVADLWQLVTITVDSEISATGFNVGKISTNYFDGTLDEIRVYNRTLSSKEVRDLYNWAPGPIGHWKMDENKSTTIAPPSSQTNGGMLVYPDGTDDTIKYRILKPDGNWTTAATTADVDTATTNKRAQYSRVYSSPSRNEKIVLSMHYDATNAYYYGQVWNGDTQSWGNVQLLDSFATVEGYPEVVDGAYLNTSGKFMAVHSNGSTTPQFSIWDGNGWSTVSSPTQNSGEVPGRIIARARPNTDEVMIVIHDNQNDTNTIYYDGAGTSTTDFTLHTEHASSSSTYRYVIDFVWSSNNPLRGALIFDDSSTDTTDPNYNIFTANGSGGGTWGTAIENVDPGVSMGAGNIIERPGTNEFLLCVKDYTATSPDINCYEERDNDTTPTLQTTTNGEITTSGHASTYSRSFSLAYEAQSAATAVVVYSDDTGIPKLKTYDSSTDTWGASATSLSDQTDAISSVILVPDPYSDDIMIVTRDIALDVSTVVWNGTTDALYTTNGKTSTAQSTASGQFTIAFSAYYAWDIFVPGTYDASSNANNGTLVGSLPSSWKSGKFGSALSFNGSTDQVFIGDQDNYDFSANLSYSIETWIKHPTQSSGQDIIVSKHGTSGSDGGYKILMESDGDITCAIDDDDTWSPDASVTSTAATYDDDAWHFISCVKDGSSSLSLYIDGTLASTNSSISGVGTLVNSDPLYIGIDSDGSSNAWLGQFDDFRIYNYARTPQQIVEDMNAGHPTGGSPIGSQVSHWKFDEANGATAYDAVGGNNLTLSNSPTWYSQTSCKVNGCLLFDGSNDIGALADASDGDLDFNGSESFTISAWISPQDDPGASDEDGIVAKWDGNTTTRRRGYRLYRKYSGVETGYIVTEIYDESTDQSITAQCSNTNCSPTYEKIHVAFSFNGGIEGSAGDLKLYINGVLAGSNSQNASFLGLEDVAADFTVGDYDVTTNDSTMTPFNGLVDELKVYNSVLTEDQVRVDYNMGGGVNFSVGQNEAAIIADGAGNPPVGYWPIDENTGTSTTNDKSGSGYNGTLTSITENSWESGKYGSALNLDGSADFIDIGTGPGDVNSVCFWVYPETSTEYFIDLNGTDYIYASSGTVTVAAFGTEIIYVNGVQTSTIAADQWSHVAITSATSVSASDLDIGRIETVGMLEGKIDEVKLFADQLTPAQIAYEYNRGRPVGWWKLDECEGATAYDSSGNGINGTISIGATGNYTSAGTCGSGTGTEAWNAGTTGRFNASLGFDNTSDLVIMTESDLHDFGDTSDFTLTGWFNRDYYGSDDTVIAKRNSSSSGDAGYMMYVDDANDNIVFEVSDGTDEYTMYSRATFTSTGWHHFAIVWDADSESSSTVYVDGVPSLLSRSGTWANIGSLINAIPTTLGSVYNGGSGGTMFSGLIDDVRIYNYSLSASQVKQVMNEGAVRFGPETGSP